MTTSWSVLHRIRNVSNKVVENKQFRYNIFSFNRVFYEILWKNIVEPDKPQMTIWLLRIVC